MEENQVEYNKKINFRNFFKTIRRTLIVIIIIFIAVIMSAASVSIILKNDTADGFASTEERKNIEEWLKED